MATAIRGVNCNDNDGIDTLDQNAVLPEQRTTGQMYYQRASNSKSNKPMNLYKSFLLAMEKQMAIDSVIIQC